MRGQPPLIRAVEGLLWLWVREVEKRPLATLGLAALGTAASLFAAALLLGVDTDTSKMLDPDLPFQQRALELREAFPGLKDDVLIVVEGRSPDEADAYVRALAAKLESDHDDAIAEVFSASASDYFIRNGLMLQPLDELEATIEDLANASDVLGAVARQPDLSTLLTAVADSAELAADADEGAEIAPVFAALSATAEARLADAPSPLAWRSLAGGGETESVLRVITVRPELDYTRLQPAKPSLRAINTALTALSPEFDDRVSAWTTGDPALRADELDSVRTGLGLSLGLSLILVAFLLWMGLRSVRLAAYVMVSLIVSLILTTGVAAVFVGQLNLVSVAFTVLLVGLGLDFAIHLLLNTEEEIATGLLPKRALLRSVRSVGGALALAAFTTALAFLSFTPTAFIGIAQLGLIAGFGVVIAFVVSITVPPALIALSPPQRIKRAAGTVRISAEQFTRRLADPAALLVLILGVVCLFLLPQTRFDADPMALRSTSAESVRGFNRLFDVAGAAPYRLSVLRADEETAAADAARLKASPGVDAARIASDFVPQDQELKLDLIEFNGATALAAVTAEPGETTTADSALLSAAAERLAAIDVPGAADFASALRALADKGDAAAAAFERDAFRYWPQFRADLATSLAPGFVSLDDLPEPIRTSYIAPDGRWRIDVTPTEDLRDPAALKTFVETVTAVSPDAAGGAAQSLGAARTISRAMLQATALSAVVVIAFLIIAVGRVTRVLLMIAPLLLAGALTMGGAVLFGMPFNYANVIVLPLLIGLGVDAGVHLVMRSGEPGGVFESSTPRAVLFSALTTAASFGSLALSPHRGTASMGFLLTISIAATLAAMLIVLPAILKRLPAPRRGGGAR